MPLLACIIEVLARERMPYVVYHHRPTYSAQEQAAVSHTPGLSAVKVVICIADGQPVQVVVPAPYFVDLERLRLAAGASHCRLATEQEIGALYPQFEIGAAPPFGALYGHRVFMEECFVGDPEMVFSAGTHTESIGMHYGDIADLVKPVLGSFGLPPQRPAKAAVVRKIKIRPSARGSSSPFAGV